MFPNTSETALQKPKILIVDDNSDNLRLLSHVLAEAGYCVQRAISGQLALNAVHTDAPDLILLDVLMPKIDGYEVCRQLKSQEQTCPIPVIFLSALTEPLNKVKAFEVGGVDFITKPFYPQEILMRVKHQLTIIKLQYELQTKNQNLTDWNVRLQEEIRERQKVENDLKKSQAELKRRNKQLKKALKNIKKYQSELVKAEKMSSLGQVVAGVAHEINNPTNFIYGNLSHTDSYVKDLLDLLQAYQEKYPNNTPKIETILEKIDLEFIKEDLPKLMNSMRSGSDRIRNIVLSLRNFSRLDESTQKSVDLHEGLNSTLLLVGYRLRGTENYLEIVVQKEYGNLPKIICNAGHINQVFMSLFNNAIDALENHRQDTDLSGIDRLPTIWIRTKLSSNETVKIEIADNGVGITQDVLPYIFDPFFTTKPVGSGAGLGLSISYSIIVEEHGGQLDCHSVFGEGTQLTIELPIGGSQ